MKLFGIELTNKEFDYLMCEQSNGKELKVIDGKVVAVERVASEKELNQLEIDKLTQKLDKTDYIANKLAEANAEYIVTEDKTKLIELRNKYSKELADRETWRKEIDSLQEKLKNL